MDMDKRGGDSLGRQRSQWFILAGNLILGIITLFSKHPAHSTLEAETIMRIVLGLSWSPL
jgi:hypothetical protein